MPSCDASWNACTGWQEKRISAPASKIEISATPKHSFANSPPPFVPALPRPSNNATNRPESQTKGDDETVESYNRSCPRLGFDDCFFDVASPPPPLAPRDSWRLPLLLLQKKKVSVLSCGDEFKMPLLQRPFFFLFFSLAECSPIWQIFISPMDIRWGGMNSYFKYEFVPAGLAWHLLPKT